MSVIGRKIAKRYLEHANSEHLQQFPQLACFSFDFITTAIHLDGQYERDQLEFLIRRVFPLLTPGACLDVGANIGNHSVQFARFFESVIAFEPHPRTFKLLSLNAELATNILPLNVGASAEQRTVTVVDNPHNMGASGVDRAGSGHSVKFELVPIDVLTEVQKLRCITLMKFDVEGHEQFALEGARNTILKHKPLIILEVSKDEVYNGSAPAPEFLRTLGYNHFYEAVSSDINSSVPRPLQKLPRLLSKVLTGKRPSKAARLQCVKMLEERNYQMLICSVKPLNPM